jgi:hypothetical protein
MYKKDFSKQTQSYAKVIVEQIERNFQKLHDTVTVCRDIKESIYAYRQDTKTNNDDIFLLQDSSEKIKLYQKNIDDLVCDDYRTIESLTVGIFGESGSGKTHQLNLIRNNIIKRTVSFPTTTIPILFNAWRYEDEKYIIIPLIKTLIEAIEDYERNFSISTKGDLKSLISNLKVILYSLSYGLNLPKNTKNLAKESSRGDIRTQLIPHEKLDSIYLNIPQYIEKITLFEKINFIFLIDDLDRCLPENTLKILNSIELYLNVPPCAFVFSLNDQIIERGIAHHYKDYQSSHNHIYNLTLNLPITGDEYLEKMIQLPTRLPTIDTANIREFLRDNSSGWIEKVDENYDIYKQSDENAVQPSRELLDFFTHSIPAKPRKIKRVAQLFESKLKLLNALELEIDLLLLAKVTLLELFSPKLLKFIQCHTKYHDSLWRRMEEFRFAGGGVEQNSLEDFEIVDKYIKKISKTEKFTKMYNSLLRHIKEHYDARDRFELDHVFDGAYKNNTNLERNLKHILESSRYVKHNEDKITKVIYSPNFEKLLFSPNDPTAWRDAFREDNLFAENKAFLTLDQLDKIMKKAKDNGLIKNVEWFTIVAKHSKSLEIAKYFSFEMGVYAITFNQYDKYCDSIGKKKPDDNEWGRGLRPVINISWDDAVSYAEWRSKKENVTYRLPTSAEWNLSCNLGKEIGWHFGDDESKLGTYAWYRDNSGKKTHPVGNKIPNDLGLYDMHGNVWEWCADWCEGEEDKKIIRGGAWNLVASDTHTNDIDCMSHNRRYGIVGFRLLKVLD